MCRYRHIEPPHRKHCRYYRNSPRPHSCRLPSSNRHPADCHRRIVRPNPNCRRRNCPAANKAERRWIVFGRPDRCRSPPHLPDSLQKDVGTGDCSRNSLAYFHKGCSPGENNTLSGMLQAGILRRGHRPRTQNHTATELGSRSHPSGKRSPPIGKLPRCTRPHPACHRRRFHRPWTYHHRLCKHPRTPEQSSQRPLPH